MVENLLLTEGRVFGTEVWDSIIFFILKAEINNIKNSLSDWEWGGLHDEVGCSQRFRRIQILVFLVFDVNRALPKCE